MSKASVALPEPRDAGDDAELAARDVDRQRLQVVLAGVDDLDGALARSSPAARGRERHGACLRLRARPRAAARAAPQPQRSRRTRAAPLAGVRASDAPSPRRACRSATTSPPPSPPSGPRSIDPVGRANHVQVVLDDDQRVAGIEQLAQRAHQLGDVVEVQAGGRLVEQEQRAARATGCRLALASCAASARKPASFSRCASPPDSVGTGWPSRT